MGSVVIQGANHSMVSSTRIWVITGSNSGLGLAIAEHVLSQGDTVRLYSPSTLPFGAYATRRS